MTSAQVTLHVLAAVVLAGICCRLLDLPRARTGWQPQAAWHAWVLAHVLIGMGMVARLFRMETDASWLVTSGLAIYFGVRWARRAGDR